MRTFLLGVLLYIAGLMLCVSLLFAQHQEARMSLGVIGGVPTSVPSKGSILSETWNSATPDNTWDITSGAGCTWDDDESTVPAAGTGFITEWFEISATQAWQACNGVATLGVEYTGNTFISFYFYVVSHGYTNDDIYPVELKDGTGVLVAKMKLRDLEGQLLVSWELANGALGTNETNVSSETKYLVQLQMNFAGGWDFNLGPVGSAPTHIESGVGDPGAGLKTIQLGDTNNGVSYRIMIDKIEIDGTAFIDNL